MQNRTRKIINIKLFDIDGCLYHAYDNGGKILSVDKWLIETNNGFLARQVKKIKEENVDEVVLGYSTNRQDNHTNQMNKGRNASMVPALPLLARYFRTSLACDSSVTALQADTFLLADIYGTHGNGGPKKSGDSYALMAQCESGVQSNAHATWMFDHSKFTILYAHAQRAANLYPDDEIVIDFYDDQEKFFEEFKKIVTIQHIPYLSVTHQ